MLLQGSLHLYLAGSALPTVLVYVIYTFLFSLFVVALFGYHTFLSLSNISTLEHLKHHFRAFHKHSVFSKRRNCINLCRKVRKVHSSHIVPRAKLA